MKLILKVLIGLAIVFELGSEPFSFKELEESNLQPIIPNSNFKTYDVLNLAYYSYKSKSEIGNLIFIHGGGAHSGAGYQKLAESLAKNYHISTYLIDLRGHGRSEGARGDSEKIISSYKDIDKFIAFLEESSQKPIYLGGHSSGGGLILNYLTRTKLTNVKGVVMLSPEFGFRSNTKRDEIVENFADPKIHIFILSAFTGKNLFNHSIAVNFNYPESVLKRDPLLINSITTNTAYALTPDDPMGQIKEVTLPIAMIIGEKDELIDPTKLKILYENIPISLKERSPFIVKPDEKHLSIILKSYQEIGKILTDWILFEKKNAKTNGNSE